VGKKLRYALIYRIKLIENLIGKYRIKHHDNHVYTHTILSPEKPLWGKTR
jgi:hypothetical protein